MTPILDPPAFAALMAPLGPWDERRIALAVSGGADSLALALLAARWGGAGRLLALVVDHGLRAESAGEASLTCVRLRGLGIASRTLRLRGLAAGPGLAARARTARYGALLAACAAEGLVDLLLGHHAGDQAETVLMRDRAGSGRAGLAGMAPVVVTRRARLVRPLLGVAPARLRAVLRAAGVGWVEDPSNADPRATRARLRGELAAGGGEVLLDCATTAAVVRRRERGEAVAALARVTIRPEGFALMPPGPMPGSALASLLRVLGGSTYPPSPARVAALAAAPGPATLGGVRMLAAGRLGPGWLLVREGRAMAASVTARDGAVWDGRFRLRGAVGPEMELGCLGEAAGRLRTRPGLPMAVLRTLPALWRHGTLVVVPHLHYPRTLMRSDPHVLFSPGPVPDGALARPAGDDAPAGCRANGPVAPCDGMGLHNPWTAPICDEEGVAELCGADPGPGWGLATTAPPWGWNWMA